MVHEAKKVIVLNLDEKPGYSGVDNPLYKENKTILLLGDAKDNLDRLEKAFGPEGSDSTLKAMIFGFGEEPQRSS